MMENIVAISGGKDSTALALRLAELNPSTDYRYICTPTGNEPPEVFDHLDRMKGLLGKSITWLAPRYNDDGKSVIGYSERSRDDDGLFDLCRRQNAIPNFRMRFCTRMLKIEPTIFYLKAHSPCVQYVGLRADEEDREGIYGDIENVQQSYPFRDWGWGIDEVWRYLDSRGVEVPYRTDCMDCYHQRIGDWWNTWNRHGLSGIPLEAELGHTFRSPGRDTWPLDLFSLAKEFEAGRRPKSVPDPNQRMLWNCDMDATCRVCTL